MSANFYEEELRQVLWSEFELRCVRELGGASPVFERLMEVFPVSGSRIDWRRVSGSLVDTEEEVDLQAGRFIDFLGGAIRKFGLSGDIIYVGDSATEFALGVALDCVARVLPALLAVPQHHYLIGPGFAWCACLTMEGDMGFGFSPASSEAK